MARYYQLGKEAWDGVLAKLLSAYRIYAPIMYEGNQDYELMDNDLIPQIIYNTPKPVTPVKTFFSPIRENVVSKPAPGLPAIIAGIPGCDLSAIDLLDKFYLDEEFPDSYYSRRRNETVLIGTDCHSANTHCHCTSYGLNPYPEKNQDMGVCLVDGIIYLSVYTSKGKKLLNKIQDMATLQAMGEETPGVIGDLRQKVKKEIEANNMRLPNYQETTNALMNAEETIWDNYCRTCVSCGACAAVCPTCTCFLLIDRPGFEKIRQLDACQYPGFERMAGGEDPLKKMSLRFKNRYLCKYLYRPEKYEAIACTGCGRCIEACIGKIDKNELLVELTK